MAEETSKKCNELTIPAQEVIKKEKEYIKNNETRDSSNDDKFWGLAISGGGIRSASFGLGIMQALVSTTPKDNSTTEDSKKLSSSKTKRLIKKPAGLLSRIDYLSTVSGGGYIGSALTWFLHKGFPDGGEAGTEAKNFPFGRIGTGGRTDRDGNLILDFIRQHSNYLIPGNGLNAISLIGVAIRSMFISLFVYLCLLTIIIIGLGYIGAFNEVTLNEIVGIGVNSTLSLPILLWLAILIIALLALSSFVFSLRTYIASDKINRYKRLILFQKIIGLAWTGVLALAVIGVLPFVYKWLPDVWQQISAGSATVIGAVIGFLEYLKKQSPASANGGKMSNILIIIGAFALIYGLLLTAYYLSNFFLGNPYFFFIGLVVVTGVLGFFVNLNYVGLHRMYRNRLMETFMPNAENVSKNQWGAATDADDAMLDNMCTEKKKEDNKEKTKCKRPYHLINTNIVLVNSPTVKYHGRGGDSFLLSPLYCGSDATCYKLTNNYMKKKGRRGMTLSTAMAISGAAVNPDTGVAGQGVMRNKLVSSLLGLLNLRLGYWTQNPKLKKHLPFPSNFFIPGLSSDIIGTGLSEDRLSIELTDGGHFENLGLYELIRRRVDVIISSDAGADPNFLFGDLANAIERVRVDFGVVIRFLPECDLGGLLPGTAKADDPETKKYNLAERSYAIAKIKYPATESESRKEGHLIYLKTTLTKDLTADIYGYKSANSTYPDQSTADQFFDEKQFEAYRELGYQLTWQMLNSDKGKEILELEEEE